MGRVVPAGVRQMARELSALRGPGCRAGRRLLPPFLLLLVLLGPAGPGFGSAGAAGASEEAAAAALAAALGKECDKPCANGGRCQPASGQCECQPGWVGDQCQHCGGRFSYFSPAQGKDSVTARQRCEPQSVLSVTPGALCPACNARLAIWKNGIDDAF